jgi:hypothetical protein
MYHPQLALLCLSCLVPSGGSKLARRMSTASCYIAFGTGNKVIEQELRIPVPTEGQCLQLYIYHGLQP